MKIKLLMICICISLFSCGGSGDDNKFNVTFYNSSDGYCAFAQEDIDYYADGKLLFTLAPAENKVYGLSMGEHEIETRFAGTEDRIGDVLSIDLIEDIYVWSGCEDGTYNYKSGLGKKQAAAVEIKKAEWYVDTLPEDYTCVSSDWTYTQQHMIYLHYGNTGTSVLTKDKVKAVYFYSYDSAIFWTRKSPDIDTVKMRLPADFGWCYELITSDNGSVIPIGRYFGKVQLTDGSTQKYEFTISHPDVADSNVTYVCSPSFTSSLPDNYVMALSHPQITSSSKNTTIDITFTVSDTKVNNGLVIFYDSNRKYMAQTVRFKDDAGSWEAFCSSGALKTDGTSNTLLIAEADIIFEVEGKDFDDIAYAAVVTINSKGTESGTADFGFLRTYSDVVSF